MSGHTSPPWTVRHFVDSVLDCGVVTDAGVYEIEEANAEIMALVRDGEPRLAEDMAEANARLIAASPDLLCVVEDCLAAASGVPKSCGHDFECACRWDAARAALKKARGQ